MSLTRKQLEKKKQSKKQIKHQNKHKNSKYLSQIRSNIKKNKGHEKHSNKFQQYEYQSILYFMKSKAQKHWKSLEDLELWVNSLWISLNLHNLAIKKCRFETKTLRLKWLITCYKCKLILDYWLKIWCEDADANK